MGSSLQPRNLLETRGTLVGALRSVFCFVMNTYLHAYPFCFDRLLNKNDIQILPPDSFRDLSELQSM